MKHKEKFRIITITGRNIYNKKEIKYKVKQILTRKQKIVAAIFIIVTLGLGTMMYRTIVTNFTVEDVVEGIYDDKKTAIKTINNYKKGLYDNSFY